MKRLICRIVGHHRDAMRVWLDGYSHRAPCRRCGMPMLKDMLGGWRPFDPSRDHDVSGAPRKGRPDHR